MANTQDIRRRIKSIRNTAQITKAMQMVAASKMRKAQQHALAGRPFSQLLNRVLVSVKSRTDPLFHPMLRVRPVRKELVLVISTDKGLAGALNTNLMREAANFAAEQTVYVSTGRKARQFIARTRRELLADFELKDAPTILETKVISKFCVEKFLNGEVDQVTVLYTHFVNTISQRPVAQTLLPISPFAFEEAAKAIAPNDGATDPMLEYIFEPSPQAVLDFMLPYYVQY
ncbi:MAG: F0F1 ATP synthase subunit gamma, partial [Chthoniobacterales bacterium]